MIGNLLLLVLALLLVVLNGFFVAAEFALVKLRHTQAVGLAENHGWRGRLLLNVHAHLDAYLSACQLGITLSSLGLGWVGEPAFAHLLQPLFDTLGLTPEASRLTAFIIAFSIISFLHIVLGELAPKSMAIRRPEAMSLWTAAPLYLFYWAMYPAIWLLNNSANALLRLAGWGDVEHTSHRYSREELKLIVGRQQPTGSAPDQDLTLMSHALELPELVAGDLMRSRDHMRSFRDGMSLADVMAEFAESRYSRYPWFDRDGEEVLGILHMKDLLVEIARGHPTDDLRPLLRPANLIALETPVPLVLERFRTGTTHLALCVEEHGRILGYFTLEDLLEVVVGDIEDEHPHIVKDAPTRGADGTLLVAGSTSIFRLERLLGHDLSAPDHLNSVGGLIVHQLQRLPEEGEQLEIDGHLFTIKRMAGHRIQAVTVRMAQAEDAGAA
ncbi:hemolysin family protein [Stenotrophomonas sp. TWI273]|jgi:CBS domain containing-hemolysin-like protein|uniref:hemolysin family protein n=2 Tax=Stenotrophomonas TaxID=40323 RepID=UPI000E9CA024|nr:hemolysin family protein [Stenotrophomonas sp.]HAU82071.1 HlyC/CorC family transporter [Stenotrophomonas sp.]